MEILNTFLKSSHARSVYQVMDTKSIWLKRISESNLGPVGKNGEMDQQ